MPEVNRASTKLVGVEVACQTDTDAGLLLSVSSIGVEAMQCTLKDAQTMLSKSEKGDMGEEVKAEGMSRPTVMASEKVEEAAQANIVSSSSPLEQEVVAPMERTEKVEITDDENEEHVLARSKSESFPVPLDKVKEVSSLPLAMNTARSASSHSLTECLEAASVDYQAECEELREEVKRLRAKLVNIVESDAQIRSDSPLVGTSGKGFYYSPGAGGGGSTNEGSRGSPPRSTSPDFVEHAVHPNQQENLPSGESTISEGVLRVQSGEEGGSVVDYLSPMRLNSDGSALLGESSLSATNTGLQHDLTHHEQEQQQHIQQQQVQQIGTVAVTQSGKGVVESSILGGKGGIEGQQGSLDLMSGYGLSYESSFGLQRVEADNKSLGSRASHASSRVGDMTTNEGLLADMRLEIAGDNILQSYGSSGEIDGQQGRADVKTIYYLQKELMSAQNRERERKI